MQRHAQRAAARGDDVLRGRAGGVEHCVAAGLENSGLRRGDFFDGAAEVLHVVEADVREHGGFGRGDDVRGVELAAHADLAYDDVAAAAQEPEHGDGRDELKLTRMVGHGVGLRAHLLGEGAERAVRDLLAVDLDPFVKAHDVGRGVKPRAQPRLVQDGGEHGAGGALAVRAGDVNELQLPLGVSEPVEQGADACEPRLCPAPIGRVDIGEGFVDVHARSLPVTATGGHRRTAENTPLRPSIQTIRISAAPVTANCTLREASWARKNACLLAPP